MKKETAHVSSSILQFVSQYIHTSNPNNATNSKEVYLGTSPDTEPFIFYRPSVSFPQQLTGRKNKKSHVQFLEHNLRSPASQKFNFMSRSSTLLIYSLADHDNQVTWSIHPYTQLKHADTNKASTATNKASTGTSTSINIWHDLQHIH